MAKLSVKSRRRPKPERVHPSLRAYLRAEVAPSEVWAALKLALEGQNESARVAASRVLMDALAEQVAEQDRAAEMKVATAEAREYLRAKLDGRARQAHRDGQSELAQALAQAAAELWAETKLPDPVVVADVSPRECRAVLEGLAERGLIAPPLPAHEAAELERLRAENRALRNELVA